jgi:hypothetical protein
MDLRSINFMLIVCIDNLENLRISCIAGHLLRVTLLADCIDNILLALHCFPRGSLKGM